MRVKICGITNLQDALDAINAGANALGFVFYKKSPRYITPLNAKKIVEQLPPFIQTVDDEEKLNYELLKIKFIKVVRAKIFQDIKKLSDDYYLIDAFVDSFGGEGKRVALEWFENIDCSKFILAGGLTSNNLKEINGYGFYAVDVSSGVEESKGKKSKQKMIDFIKEANEIK